jgi:hypothetical protein
MDKETVDQLLSNVVRCLGSCRNNIDETVYITKDAVGKVMLLKALESCVRTERLIQVFLSRKEDSHAADDGVHTGK